MNTAKQSALLCMWVVSTHCSIEFAVIKGNTLFEGLVPMVDSFCLLEEKPIIRPTVLYDTDDTAQERSQLS